jgi:hypothetical protein
MAMFKPKPMAKPVMTPKPVMGKPVMAPPTPQPVVGKKDAFYKSPQYKEFQKNSVGRPATMDMYNSPYFGSVGSGSVGRAQDDAYRKYKGIAEPTPVGVPVGVPVGSSPAPIGERMSLNSQFLPAMGNNIGKPATGAPSSFGSALVGSGGPRPAQPTPQAGKPMTKPLGAPMQPQKMMKKGGAVKAPAKKMASGGKVSSASKRGDGIASKGKTNCKMY